MSTYFGLLQVVSLAEESGNTIMEPTDFYLNTFSVSFDVFDKESKTVHWFCTQRPLECSQLKTRLDGPAEVILVIRPVRPTRGVIRLSPLKAVFQPIVRFTFA